MIGVNEEYKGEKWEISLHGGEPVLILHTNVGDISFNMLQENNSWHDMLAVIQISITFLTRSRK